MIKREKVSSLVINTPQHEVYLGITRLLLQKRKTHFLNKGGTNDNKNNQSHRPKKGQKPKRKLVMAGINH